ncbi:Ras association domain-containing protein 8 [Striga asiatica]|uniref:Ras association domain-containing protein 8 n=1 Tax=Striga asiatica TaxID=4170 RepID=A0A5A7R8W9_STRAF|nr:Ras association domain-containing protein 8 [Striga asiatica]
MSGHAVLAGITARNVLSGASSAPTAPFMCSMGFSCALDEELFDEGFAVKEKWLKAELHAREQVFHRERAILNVVVSKVNKEAKILRAKLTALQTKFVRLQVEVENAFQLWAQLSQLISSMTECEAKSREDVLVSLPESGLRMSFLELPPRDSGLL